MYVEMTVFMMNWLIIICNAWKRIYTTTTALCQLNPLPSEPEKNVTVCDDLFPRVRVLLY